MMMDETARREFLRMVANYQDRGDPTGWCDQVYRAAQGDFRAVFWADLVPNPYLVSWLENHPVFPNRLRALNAIAGLVAPGGTVLVSCRSRQAEEKENEFPLPLDRAEIDGFVRAGLREDAFEAYDDNQNPPIPHFFACYSRPIETGV